MESTVRGNLGKAATIVHDVGPEGTQEIIIGLVSHNSAAQA